MGRRSKRVTKRASAGAASSQQKPLAISIHGSYGTLAVVGIVVLLKKVFAVAARPKSMVAPLMIWCLFSWRAAASFALGRLVVLCLVSYAFQGWCDGRPSVSPDLAATTAIMQCTTAGFGQDSAGNGGEMASQGSESGRGAAEAALWQEGWHLERSSTEAPAPVAADSEGHSQEEEGGGSSGRRARRAERRVCTACGEGGARQVCARCRSARYCNTRCQSIHWQEHKLECQPAAAPPLMAMDPEFEG